MQRNYSGFKQGDVVVVEVRFSNDEAAKLRPALVISSTNYNQNSQDIIVLKITSKIKNRPFELTLTQNDLTQGRLNVESTIKADFPVVIVKERVEKKIAEVNKEKIQETKEKLKQIFEL